MLWKSVTALIVLFWLAMTSLLIRHTYFPDAPVLTSVPVVQALDHIANHRHVSTSTLTLTQHGKRQGSADLNISEWRELQSHKRLGFHFQAGGQVVAPGQETTMGASLTWRFDGDFKEAGGWQQLSLAARVPATDTSLFIGWKQGDEQPKIEVWRNKELVMDTKRALEEARQKQGAGSLGLMGGMLPGMFGSQSVSLENLIQLRADEGIIPIAGKKRKGRILTIALMGFYQAKASYTEDGELTRVELPQGWQLIDPLLEGLDAALAP